MPSKSKIIVAAAGAGKTTEIIREAFVATNKKVLITTFTINNAGEIRKKFYDEFGYIPPHVQVTTWFSFLLSETVRPYQTALYDRRRIDGMILVEGKSALKVPEQRISHFLADDRNIYSDKISKFAVRANEKTNGEVLSRLCQIFDRVYVDEVQDLAGWDLNLLELMLKSEIELRLFGDIRQGTYKTNHASKNKQFGGAAIFGIFEKWKKAGLCEIEVLDNSYRCNQPICNFADHFFPDAPNTKSLNPLVTGHDGLFIVRSCHVAAYVDRYKPQVLRYSRATDCGDLAALNFGESKGMTFERTLVYPHGPLQKLLKNGDFSKLKEPSKLYVAVTRARFSVAFVYDGVFEPGKYVEFKIE